MVSHTRGPKLNISNLISETPELLEDLKGLGLGPGTIDAIAASVTEQLSGDDPAMLADKLVGLNSDSFFRQLDVDAVAEQALISPQRAQQALLAIAPWVERFGQEVKGSGILRKLLGGLFQR